ncbi:MAG TPA: hypothetical protein PK402_00420 [Tepidisphaeraceae bacterium]|nr:hypothetical protein [Tepidisphaeraceae bacterium]
MRQVFIPSGDVEFRDMAKSFVTTIQSKPETYGASKDELEMLTSAVGKFNAKLSAARQNGNRSQQATREKEQARAEAERIIRKVARRIRADDSICELDRSALGLPKRAALTKHRSCPREAPMLRFVNANHRNWSTPIHELKFGSANMNKKAKPPGAVRLELFAALIPPEQKVVGNVIENLHARPWYLRSFTRSPIRITPPLANIPMRVVYWARWADSLGNVGPFSAPAVGWVEGGSHMPALLVKPSEVGRNQPIKQIQIDRTPFNDEQERIYWVAIGTAQMMSLNPTNEFLALVDESEKKLLDGPDVAAA